MSFLSGESFWVEARNAPSKRNFRTEAIKKFLFASKCERWFLSSSEYSFRLGWEKKCSQGMLFQMPRPSFIALHCAKQFHEVKDDY